jgi:poly-gamma-glutamate capsule biosynthesis protein CapA/YwtB (metallophosphatase superfamily)
VTVFACGDVMPGRGVDQILPHPGDPELREPYVRDARAYWIWPRMPMARSRGQGSGVFRECPLLS